MGYVIKSKQDNILKDDALAISRVANLDKGGINATVGAFQPFEVFSFVQEIESNLSTKEKYSYSSVDGGENFRRAVNSYLGLEGHYVVSTPGGTGAITCSVSLTLEKGESLLTPYPCWGPYFGIAKGNGLMSVTYNLIKDNHFDLEDFINKANEIIKNEHKLVFILNDPCQNPTGYSLTDDEINALFSFLNKQSVPVSVLIVVLHCQPSALVLLPRAWHLAAPLCKHVRLREQLFAGTIHRTGLDAHKHVYPLARPDTTSRIVERPLDGRPLDLLDDAECRNRRQARRTIRLGLRSRAVESDSRELQFVKSALRAVEVSFAVGVQASLHRPLGRQQHIHAEGVVLPADGVIRHEKPEALPPGGKYPVPIGLAVDVSIFNHLDTKHARIVVQQLQKEHAVIGRPCGRSCRGCPACPACAPRRARAASRRGARARAR